MNSRRSPSQHSITLDLPPPGTLSILIGPSAAGKTFWVAKWVNDHPQVPHLYVGLPNTHENHYERKGLYLNKMQTDSRPSIQDIFDRLEYGTAQILILDEPILLRHPFQPMREFMGVLKRGAREYDVAILAVFPYKSRSTFPKKGPSIVSPTAHKWLSLVDIVYALEDGTFYIEDYRSDTWTSDNFRFVFNNSGHPTLTRRLS